MGFCPFIFNLFHDYEVKIISVCDTSPAEIDQVSAAWGKCREYVSFLLIVNQSAHFCLEFQLFFGLRFFYFGLLGFLLHEGERGLVDGDWSIEAMDDAMPKVLLLICMEHDLRPFVICK